MARGHLQASACGKLSKSCLNTLYSGTNSHQRDTNSFDKTSIFGILEMSLRSLLWHQHLLHSKMSSYSPKNPDPMSPIAGNKETKSHVLLQHLHRDLQVQVGFPLSRLSQTLGLLWISMATTHPGAIYSVASGARCACSGSHVNTWLLSLIISAVFSFTAAEEAKQEKHTCERHDYGFLSKAYLCHCCVLALPPEVKTHTWRQWLIYSMCSFSASAT